MSRKRFKAATRLLQRERKTLPEGRIPGHASAFLNARGGDVLVFEEGSWQAAERAAAHGPYLILRKATSVELQAVNETEAEHPTASSLPPPTIITGELSADAREARRLLGGD